MADAPIQETNSNCGSVSSALSSTAQFSASIFEHRIINGRQYHFERGNDVHYWYITFPSPDHISFTISHFLHQITYISLALTSIEPRGPNDDAAGESMDIQHHIWSLCFDNALFCAPIEKDVNLTVDIGTGTGLWAL